MSEQQQNCQSIIDFQAQQILDLKADKVQLENDACVARGEIAALKEQLAAKDKTHEQEILKLNDNCAAKPKLPIPCPESGNHDWTCECRKCGMKLYYNLDLHEQALGDQLNKEGKS